RKFFFNKMNYLIRQRIQNRLRGEQGAYHRAGAGLRVGIAYPNKYFFGMSNLGFQTLYAVLNRLPDTSCERFFLPEEDLLAQHAPGGLQGYELGSSARELAMVAFSVSYQNDYLNLIPMLHLMGLKSRSQDRDEGDPLILVGGPAATINPEPIADFCDALVIGEGEEVIERIADILRGGGSKASRLEQLDKLDGVYVPALFNPATDRGAGGKATAGFGLVSGKANGRPQEGRFIRYPSYDALEPLKRRIDHGLQYRKKIGLIAGDLLGHDAIHEILEYIDAQGGGFSPSSVRLNAFTPEIIHYLRKSGNKTIAIAPEAGSERLRRSLNKTFSDDEVVESAVKLAEGGILNIKLYIMIGLPTETEVDVDELCRLTLRTREALTRFAKRSAKMPSLTLSVSPFTPKPSTPLQYSPFVGVPALKEKLQNIRKQVLQVGHIRMSGESGLDAYIETLLSRGDRRVGEFLHKALVPAGKALVVGSAAHLRKSMLNLSFDPETFVSRTYRTDEPLPWDFIDHGMKDTFLIRELGKFESGKITHYCMPEVCRSCGVC
ncbi:MAG: B12-binding domain-containing radical SAM protein, partial [Deltaproteobacteria bacterium]|nr:B12-binding domain-containing radical SAM protein [Deltaproteobacteria bacterium]